MSGVNASDVVSRHSVISAIYPRLHNKQHLPWLAKSALAALKAVFIIHDVRCMSLWSCLIPRLVRSRVSLSYLQCLVGDWPASTSSWPWYRQEREIMIMVQKLLSLQWFRFSISLNFSLGFGLRRAFITWGYVAFTVHHLRWALFIKWISATPQFFLFLFIDLYISNHN